LELSFETIVCDMFSEAIKRDPKKNKKWVALVDGDPKQIRYLEKHAKKHAIHVTVICDFIHVLEYIWKASNVFFTETKKPRILGKREIVTSFTR